MKVLRITVLVFVMFWFLSLAQIQAQTPDYINPAFTQAWVLPTTSSAHTDAGTWQQAITGGYDIDGDGKGEFFTSYVSEDGNKTWKFFEFRANTTGGYDLVWSYTQTGMSASLEANQRMMVWGDWNNDGKKELIVGIDPESKDSVNILVFEPNAAGVLPAKPTAKLLTPKLARYFSAEIGLQQRWSWEGQSYISDINKDGKNEFVGMGLLGIMVARYSGSWSDPNAADNVVYDYVEKMTQTGSALADMDGNGTKEILNITPPNFGPPWSPIDSLNQLPGDFHRIDHFVILGSTGGNAYSRLKMMANATHPNDSIGRAKGYTLLPYNFFGCWHAAKGYDIDKDGREEVFIADWGNGTQGLRYWMIKLKANQTVASLDSTNFYELGNIRSLFSEPYPDPLHPMSLEIADMDGNGKAELYKKRF